MDKTRIFVEYFYIFTNKQNSKFTEINNVMLFIKIPIKCYIEFKNNYLYFINLILNFNY